MEKKRIVILGAGFGGLHAAFLISKKLKKLGLLGKYEVIIVDRNEHQTYTPLLYEAATTSKMTADSTELHSVVAYSIAKLIRRLPIRFIQSEVKDIDIPQGEVKLANQRKLASDYLVLALGSEANYFNIPGLKENSLPLKTFIDALRIRDTILNLIEGGDNNLKIVIGGGGSTGVELAGELKMWCGELSDEEYNKCRIDIAVIEAAPTILPEFSPKVISLVKKRLSSLGVNLIEGQTIEEVGKNVMVLKSSSTGFGASGKKINFDILIWAGGVKASSLIENLPLKTESRGRFEVAENMRCLPKTPDLKIYPKVYAIGDNACVYDKNKKPIPGVARAAIKEAEIAAHNIIEEIKNSEFRNWKLKIRNYAPRQYPYVIPVGGKFAVAEIGSFVLSGFLGWIFKGLVELNYLLSIMPVWKALLVWLKGLKIFIQNDRLG